ncbi:hypothetical protein ACGFNP_11115 [Nonomuraea sp. NPDC049269]|uniref:hypothetical protein n=1 Tax=Nonomuraea sp. NPDC049269 TaxID=3364349 RepID=UPI0037191EB3
MEDKSDGGPPEQTGGPQPRQADDPPPGQTSGPAPQQADGPPPGEKPKRPPTGKSIALIIGLAFAGLVAYSIVNAILGILIFISTLDQNGPNHPIIISCTIFLALLGLGAGAGLQFLHKPWATGLGLGFLIGWVLWTILSAGIVTGVSPDLYT